MSQATEIVSALALTFAGLRERAGTWDGWVDCPLGADLWVDGYAALRGTEDSVFAQVLREFLRHPAALDLLSSGQKTDAARLLGQYDNFLRAVAAQNEDAFLPSLALGFALLQTVGIPPVMEDHDVSIVNDSLLLLLSPVYREVRFRAHNAGVFVRTSHDTALPTFRPEYGFFTIGPPYLLRGKPDRVQHFNINHDLAHIVLFGDAYLRRTGSPAETSALLLNAEETCCTLDLLVVSDLARFKVPLRALAEYETVEKGVARHKRRSVMTRIACDSAQITTYQRALKCAAQRILETQSDVSRELAVSTDSPADVADWIPHRAQELHAKYAASLGRRVHNQHFARLVSYLVPNSQHAHNLLAHAHGDWDWEHCHYSIPVPDTALRQRQLARNELRRLVIRAAEFLASPALTASTASTLSDALAPWAIRASLASESSTNDVASPGFFGERNAILDSLSAIARKHLPQDHGPFLRYVSDSDVRLPRAMAWGPGGAAS